MEFGTEKSIYYFYSEGKQNLPKTTELVLERARETGIKNIIVFTADGEGAFLLKESLTENDHIKIHAASFPYKQVFNIRDEQGNMNETIAGTSKGDVRKKLKRQGINLIQGVMPLQEIAIPGVKDIKTQSIHYTLSLISGGLRLCIQSILMAADGGHIESGDIVIAMSADTAIVAKSSLSNWLFHPNHGLEIREIICKPSVFTITHSDTK